MTTIEDSQSEVVLVMTFFKSVIKYITIATVIPLTSFFLSKMSLDGVLGENEIWHNVYSGVVAFIVLNITIAIFLYRAWIQNKKAEEAAKEHQN